MRPATPAELTDALSHALRYEGKRRVYDADLTMAQITAEALVRHLEASGFVLMRKEGGAAPRAPESYGKRP